MDENYDELKAKYIEKIIGNKSSDRTAVERRIERLTADYDEREARLMQKLKDVKRDHDKQLVERALAELQTEKAPLDDAIVHVLKYQNNVKLPALDEATHTIRKTMGVSYNVAVLPKALFNGLIYTLLGALAFICFMLPMHLILEMSNGNVRRFGWGKAVNGFIPFWLGSFEALAKGNVEAVALVFLLLSPLLAGLIGFLNAFGKK